MNNKPFTQRLIVFTYERLKESSTWQAVAFILTFTGTQWAADFDTASATAFGALASATIKLLLPDTFAKTHKE